MSEDPLAAVERSLAAARDRLRGGDVDPAGAAALLEEVSRLAREAAEELERRADAPEPDAGG